MKRNEVKELHTKTAKELWDLLKKLKTDVMKLKIDVAQNKVGNVRQISGKLDDIARILTVIRGEGPVCRQAGLKIMNILEGVVVRKGKDTILIEVTRRIPAPMYKKLIKRKKRYKVDPAGVEVGLGDTVAISETRPVSKEKHFKVLKVIIKKGI